MNRKMNYREKMIRELLFAVVTILLILCIAFFACGTVVSQANGITTVGEEEYRILEKEYIREIQGFLAGEGFENSGVNLTVTLEENGTRNYQVKVYHKRMERLSYAERGELLTSIENMAFMEEGCHFEISVLL